MMKKITLALLAFAAFSGSAFGQAVVAVEAPQYNGDFSAFVGPNGIANGTINISYHRACYLIDQSELTRLIATNSVITNFGLDIYRPANVASAGQFTLYLENTSDVTYNKGTNWATITTGMSTNYTGNLTLPLGSQSATNSISVPLTSNFTYTGGGLYVAMDWSTTATTASLTTRYLTHFDVGTGMGVNSSAPAAGPAPATLTVDTRRPVMRFTATNTATNEVGVVSMKAPGLVSKLVNPGHEVSAIIRNNGINALTNVPVTLTVTGVNPYTTTVTVPNVAAGGTANVSFNAYNPTASGISTLAIIVGSDEFNNNNGRAWTQSVTCYDYGNNPPMAASGFSDASYGYGSQAIIATPLNPASTASITGIKFASSSSGAGASICGVLLDAAGTILAMTNTVNLTGGSFGAYTNLKFTPSLELTGGTNYFYGIAQLTAATFPFGTSDVLATTSVNQYFTVPIAGGSIGSAQNHMGYLGLQAVLGFSNTTLTASASQTMVCKADGPLTVTLTASGMSTFTWQPGGQGASIVVTPTVAQANGNVNYNVTGTDAGSGCKSTAVAVTVSVSACTALSSNTSGGYDIKLFPNPSSNGKSTISGLVGTNAITVYNTLGQIVLTQVASDETTSIDLSNQPSGNYLVKITNSSSESRTIKIVNQN